MEKGTFDIHLVDFPSEVSSKGKNQSNEVHLCNRGKGLSVVDSFLLREAFRDQMSLVMLKRTIQGKFGLINPSVFNKIISNRLRN